MTTKPALKRELGLRDLTLFAVTCIISATMDSYRRACRTRFRHALVPGSDVV
jgi:hypothetical protein